MQRICLESPRNAIITSPLAELLRRLHKRCLSRFCEPAAGKVYLTNLAQGRWMSVGPWSHGTVDGAVGDGSKAPKWATHSSSSPSSHAGPQGEAFSSSLSQAGYFWDAGAGSPADPSPHGLLRSPSHPSRRCVVLGLLCSWAACGPETGRFQTLKHVFPQNLWWDSKGSYCLHEAIQRFSDAPAE